MLKLFWKQRGHPQQICVADSPVTSNMVDWKDHRTKYPIYKNFNENVGNHLQQCYFVLNFSMYSADSQTDCIVCMDKARDSVLLPCGHLGVCIDCGNSLITTTRTCPICRQPIDKVQRVYQP